MRLLYLCADGGISLRGTKGASAHVRQVTAALARRGHEVTVACRRFDGDCRPSADVETALMPGDESAHAEWLHALVRRRAVDAVIERYSLASGPGHHVAAAQQIPLVLEVNAPLVDEAARFRGLRDAPLRRAREAALLRAADAVVAVSEAIAAHCRAAGVAGDRIRVIPNGVDAAAFAGTDGTAVRLRLGLSPADPVVGFCGSLKPWHGVDVLVDAVALLGPGPTLLVVGDGPESAAVRARARALGLAAATVMTGGVPHDAVPGHLAAMDVGVAPYRAMDPFYFSPLKVVEYLAAGLPVVASDLGSLRDLTPLVEVVPPDDAPALARALAALLADPPARRRLGDRGRAFAATRTWDGVAQRLEEIVGTGRVAA